MNIVLDSNVLFSALIKDSLTRKLILEHQGFFFFPGFILNELQKYKKDIIDKSGMERNDFDKLLQLILKRVLIVPSDALYPFRKEALEIVKNIDIDDVIFIACCLAYPDSILWSDDKKLKRQSAVKVLNTKEISYILG